MEEYIPTFENEEVNNSVVLLKQVDEFEEKIKKIKELTSQYDGIKANIKEQMQGLAKETNATQVKWTTPKGIMVTLSVGTKAEYEKKDVEEFNMIKFMEEQPEIYEKYLEKKNKEVCIKNATSDRLTITLPKEK